MSAEIGIDVRNVTKDFGTFRALDDVTLQVRRGEIFGLLGPNGSGKSTTIDMLLGLSLPDSGSVSIFGMTPAQAIAQGRVGAMLQVGQLIHDLKVR